MTVELSVCRSSDPRGKCILRVYIMVILNNRVIFCSLNSELFTSSESKNHHYVFICIWLFHSINPLPPCAYYTGKEWHCEVESDRESIKDDKKHIIDSSGRNDRRPVQRIEKLGLWTHLYCSRTSSLLQGYISVMAWLLEYCIFMLDWIKTVVRKYRFRLTLH